MVTNDLLAACLSKINNSEKVAKTNVVVNGMSKMIKSVLTILQKSEYVGNVTYEENKKGGKIVIELLDRINKCGAIKPRFKVQFQDIEKYEQRYLPARGFGLLIMSTSKGLMTNTEAKEKHIGGRLIAYCY
jgi:small subunit ribosomal protein S8